MLSGENEWDLAGKGLCFYNPQFVFKTLLFWSVVRKYVAMVTLIHVTIVNDWLAQLLECQTAVWEVSSSSPRLDQHSGS